MFGKVGILIYLCTQLTNQEIRMEKKNLYIICGCNGAGKTTASYSVLPQILQCREFVNADEIARGLSQPIAITNPQKYQILENHVK